jgi:hypothetical membrane protein
VAALQWLINEAIAASAWHTPPYSYVYNYISDLGVPGCGTFFEGRDQCSPLAGVMNAGFYSQAILFAVGVVLLSSLARSAWRVVFIVLACLHLVGLTLVGTFHGGAANEADGTLIFHGLGAFAAIGSANLVAFLSGMAGGSFGAPRWFRIFSLVVPVLGTVSGGILLAKATGGDDGVFERGGVYSFVLWELVAGLLVLVAARTHRATTQVSWAR